MRSVFNKAVALLGLFLLIPLFVVIGIAIVAYDRGAVFHRGIRIGRGGKTFALLKFRSMVVNAEMIGPGLTRREDRRITPVGRVLRRTKFDELPQLLNVVKGDMDLVGPRPEDPRYVALYSARMRDVLKYSPGITSPASIMFRNEEELLTGPDSEQRYFNEVLPAKIATDLAYLEHRTLLTDCLVLAKTSVAVILGALPSDSTKVGQT
jgi:lipopolysaccharide/colanic/teichoic acid biosynthesis glycosyltransferase